MIDPKAVPSKEMQPLCVQHKISTAMKKIGTTSGIGQHFQCILNIAPARVRLDLRSSYNFVIVHNQSRTEHILRCVCVPKLLNEDTPLIHKIQKKKKKKKRLKK